MILKWNTFVLNESIKKEKELIQAKESEIKDLISNMSNRYGISHYFKNNESNILDIVFSHKDFEIEYRIFFNSSEVKKYTGGQMKVSIGFSTIDEAFSIIEKDLISMMKLS